MYRLPPEYDGHNPTSRGISPISQGSRYNQEAEAFKTF